jgi:hypothetical protein
MSRIDEPDGLLTEHLLLKMTMKKSIRDIHLVHWPAARDRKLENGKNGVGFDNRSKGVMEVDTFTLPETANHPARLVTIKSAIWMKFMLEDPLPSNDIGMSGTWNELPCVVALQGIELLLHSGKPRGVAKRRPGRGGER